MNLNEIGRKIASEPGCRTVGPPHLFGPVGRNTFATALEEGLLADHYLLDFGAGCFRLGYWFLRFLDPGRYYAIEPVVALVNAGRKHLFSDELWAFKKPGIDHNGDCAMGVFGVKFDFVIARSLLTHTAPGMLNTIIREFAANRSSSGKLLASYWREDIPNKPVPGPKWKFGDDLPPDLRAWLPHCSYTLAYMEDRAAAHGLQVEEIPSGPLLNGQRWLVFTPARRLRNQAV